MAQSLPTLKNLRTLCQTLSVSAGTFAQHNRAVNLYKSNLARSLLANISHPWSCHLNTTTSPHLPINIHHPPPPTMKATNCLLALLPILGVLSAQLAVLPISEVHAAPLNYASMPHAPLTTRDADVLALAARDPEFISSHRQRRPKSHLQRRKKKA